MRFANSRQELEAIEWVGPAGPSSWFENEQTLEKKYPGRWIQYKLALGSKSGATPRVVEVEVEYT
jgi:hypothetical protein